MKKMRTESDTAQNNFVWTKYLIVFLWFVWVSIHYELKMDKQDLQTGKS